MGAMKEIAGMQFPFYALTGCRTDSGVMIVDSMEDVRKAQKNCWTVRIAHVINNEKERQEWLDKMN